MDIQIKVINQLSDNYSYVIYSNKTKKALVVDPSESETIINFIKSQRQKLNKIIFIQIFK